MLSLHDRAPEHTLLWRLLTPHVLNGAVPCPVRRVFVKRTRVHINTGDKVLVFRVGECLSVDCKDFHWCNPPWNDNFIYVGQQAVVIKVLGHVVASWPPIRHRLRLCMNFCNVNNAAILCYASFF